MMNERVYTFSFNFYVILVSYQMYKANFCFWSLVVESITITAKYVASTPYVSPVLK